MCGNNNSNFINLKLSSHNQKVMALDVSKKNIGIALSDETKIIAFAYKTIKRTKLKHDLKELLEIINIENIFCIVLGLPLTLNGKQEERVQSIKSFHYTLNKFLKENNKNISFYFQDERYSTIFAKENKYPFGGNHKNKNHQKNNILLDATAAAWFLQNFIDTCNRLY